MKNKKIILALLFAIVANATHAQEDKVFIPLEGTPKTISFKAHELLVNNAFIDSLNNIVLFGKRGPGIPADDSWRNFHLTFKEKDSLNYTIQVWFDDIPGIKARGFFEQNGYLYWFGKVPPGIILETTKSERQFSFGQIISSFYDPSIWFLTYNHQTGKIVEDAEWPSDW